MQDVKSAEMLVHEADLILQKQDDPGAYGTRQVARRSRSAAQPAGAGPYRAVPAAGGVAWADRPAQRARPEFVNGEALPENAQDSRWQRWLNELTRYVRVDFDASADVKPLLAGQTLGQVRGFVAGHRAGAVGRAQWQHPGLSAVAGAGEHTAQDHFSDDNGQAVACASAWKPLPSARLR